jgi:hypothetical protein
MNELINRLTGAGLTERQSELLHEWAYPFVMDQFQFHMTLSGSLKNVDPQQKADLTAAALEWFAPVLEMALTLMPSLGFLKTKRMATLGGLNVSN